MAHICFNKRQLLFFVLFFVFSWTQCKEKWITIFVHGIMSIQPYLSPGLVCKLFNDSIENTLYADVIHEIRKDNLFGSNQLMQEIGLRRIDIHDYFSKKYSGSKALATLYNIILEQENPQEENIFYTFGWTGLLSKKARIEAANQLFYELNAEIERLRKNNYNPHIRLIGYSHGANVCLNLAGVQKNRKKKPFIIDELILLGCPIQIDNDFLVNDPLFKEVYNFYSCKDRIQKRDCFSSKKFSSDRRFHIRAQYGISRKVTQAQIKITRLKPTIIGNKRKKIIERTKKVLHIHSSYALKDESPGHMELWFFGWTPRHYRKTFVLYPYPVFLFLPIIIHALKKSGMRHNGTCEQIIVDIRPEHEIIIIRNDTRQYIQPFQFNTLKTYFEPVALKAKPEQYTKEMVEYRIDYNKQKIKEKRLRYGIPDSRSKRLRK